MSRRNTLLSSIEPDLKIYFDSIVNKVFANDTRGQGHHKRQEENHRSVVFCWKARIRFKPIFKFTCWKDLVDSLRFLVVHLCFISASFVFPKTYVWRRAPFRNLVWTIMCPLIIILQLFYFYSDVQTYKNTPFSIPNTPGQVWIAGVVWCLLALFLTK